ncbi:MAG: hypothetical protein NTNFB02_07400 [Nitrospira sp.]
MKSCKACQRPLMNPVAGTYSVCFGCQSANYISDETAETDNNRYFDSVYSEPPVKPIANRRSAFVKYERLYSLFHRQATRRFLSILDRLAHTICSAGAALEVGFGRGDELIQFLSQGANIYGVDINSEAVTRFQARHPIYADRVATVSDWRASVDVLYSNAVFEHLDHPGEFLRRAWATLKPNGKLLMRLPVITCDRYAESDIAEDINFWRPCHRALYTINGLKALLGNNGFEIVDSNGYVYYGYKVMSAMLRHGYRDIEVMRDPCLPIKRLESDASYTKMLRHGLLKKTICADFAFIAVKSARVGT